MNIFADMRKTGRPIHEFHGYRQFSATFRADGPWEAMFFFCGRYHFDPSDVIVSPNFRVRNGEYSCVVYKDWLNTSTRFE